MGFWNKVGLHIADKYLATQMQGLKMGLDITDSAKSKVVKGVGMIGGVVIGSAIGIARVWNPLDIADSFLAAEKDMEEKVDKKMKSLDMDGDTKD